MLRLLAAAIMVSYKKAVKGISGHMTLTDTRNSKRRCRKLEKRTILKNSENTGKLEKIKKRKEESGSKEKEKEGVNRMREKHLPKKKFFLNSNFIFPL